MLPEKRSKQVISISRCMPWSLPSTRNVTNVSLRLGWVATEASDEGFAHMAKVTTRANFRPFAVDAESPLMGEELKKTGAGNLFTAWRAGHRNQQDDSGLRR